MALKDVKAKIQATNRMHKVTRAMEAVSAVKMRKTQGAALAGRAYARAALAILTRLSGTPEYKTHTLRAVRPITKTALVIITSDKGLAGSLNASVLKAAEHALKGKDKDAVLVYAYGKKGQEHFARRGYAIERYVENKQDDVSLPAIEVFAAELVAGFTENLFDEVLVVYNNFKSTFEQLPTARTLLPLSLASVSELVHDIIPVKGKWSDTVSLDAPSNYTVEPSASVVLETLLPRLVAVSLYHLLLESKASEHSARMVAMKNASDKSKEVARDLTRTFNKIRQAAITREVSEIVSGREALAS